MLGGIIVTVSAVQQRLNVPSFRHLTQGQKKSITGPSAGRGNDNDPSDECYVSVTRDTSHIPPPDGQVTAPVPVFYWWWWL